MIAAATVSLAILEAHDPYAPTAGSERRFLCPFPECVGHQDARRHRSLAIRIETGAWHCHRCKASGLLTERWTPTTSREHLPRRERTRNDLRRRFSVPAETLVESLPEHPTVTHTGKTGADWRSRLGTLSHLTGPTGRPGAAYLQKRGLSPDLCHRAGVRFAPDFGTDTATGKLGWPAVVFPILGPDGKAVAAHGRAINGTAKITFGPKSRGVFATPSALHTILLVVTEAPIDALSLAECGLPSLATIGTDGIPDWFRERAAFHTVLAAHDNDEAGEKAAGKLREMLAPLGARVLRLRPPEGFKDWNEAMLGWGSEQLADWLVNEIGTDDAAVAAFMADFDTEVEVEDGEEL